MNDDTTDLDPAENWVHIQHGYALQRLKDARAAVQQVSATVAHNPTPEWLAELERCKGAVAEAEKTVARFEAEIKERQGRMNLRASQNGCD